MQVNNAILKLLDADNISNHAASDVRDIYNHNICATCKHCHCRANFYDGSYINDNGSAVYTGDKVHITIYCDVYCANVFDSLDSDLVDFVDICSDHEDIDTDE